MRAGVNSVLMAVAILATCPAAHAGGCDEWTRKTVRATGIYVPAQEPYSRPFVFAMQLDCRGRTELVTVQRPTGHLPVCRAGQTVEVEGKLIWNKALVDGHYEINEPSDVVCR